MQTEIGQGATIVTPGHLLAAERTADPAALDTLLVEPARRALLVLLATYLLLAFWYDSSTPILEASDELYHYAAVEQIAAGRGLPILGAPAGPGGFGPRQEAGQPPLYYLLAAALIAPIHAPSEAAVIQVNPHSFIGRPSWLPFNENLVLHSHAEAFPYHGIALAVHVARWLSIALGAVTIAMTFLLARQLVARDIATAVVTTALVAFNPMVLFISASVDNDAMTMALCSAATVRLVRGWQRGVTRRGLIVLALLLGLAALSKLSALGLLPVAAVVLLRDAHRRRRLHEAMVNGLLLGLVVLVVAGWWYVRNVVLYGDPTDLREFLAVAGGRPPMTVAEFLRELPGLWTAYWGVFGGFDILAPGWVYAVDRLLTALAAGGLLVALVVHLRQRRSGRRLDAVWSIPLLWIAIETIALVRWTSLTMASSGRLLFPAVASITSVAAIGLLAWLPQRSRRAGAGAVAVVLAVCAALVPALAIRPAYAQPAPLAATAVPAGLHAANIAFGTALTLRGVSWPAQAVRPGATVPISLYWQARRPMTENYSASIQLVGTERQTVAQLDMLVGSGLRSTSTWHPGEIFRDRYPVTIPVTVVAPSELRVRLAVYVWGKQGTLPAATPSGSAAQLIVGSLLVGSPHGAGPAVPNPLTASFGGVVALRGYQVTPSVLRPGGTLVLTLYWQSIATTPVNYTVFVHVTNAQGRKAGQHDAQPLDGQHPTSVWTPGELVVDRVTVPIASDAAGLYSVRVGLYNLATMQRLPLAGGAESLSLARVTVATAP